MKLGKIAALFVLAGMSASALATNGYFSHGYGMKTKAMGGAGIAFAQDAMAAATNPAGMAMVGSRIDFGMDWFRPIRDAELATGMAFINGNYSGSDTKDFLIPEFGYNRMMNDRLALGVVAYGNGGMNTDYQNGVPLLGTSRAGVNLMQLIVSPTVAYKLTPNHAIGFSLNLVHQRFSAKGVQNFRGMSQSGGDLTNQGTDSSNGLGFRIGYTGQVSDMLSVGATYQSKARMSRFNDYKGLFAESGDFDIPENYGLGIAVKPTPALTVALDVVRIKYSDVKSVHNSMSNLFAGNLLGTTNGPGFAWDDMTVYKLGVNYEYSKNLTLRAGYNHGNQPIPKAETFFNILAPGIVENHLTFGATWTLANKDELTLTYMHAFEKKLNGSGSVPSMPAMGMPGGEVNLKMKQDSLGIAYGWKL